MNSPSHPMALWTIKYNTNMKVHPKMRSRTGRWTKTKRLSLEMKARTKTKTYVL